MDSGLERCTQIKVHSHIEFVLPVKYYQWRKKAHSLPLVSSIDIFRLKFYIFVVFFFFVLFHSYGWVLFSNCNCVSVSRNITENCKNFVPTTFFFSLLFGQFSTVTIILRHLWSYLTYETTRTNTQRDDRVPPTTNKYAVPAAEWRHTKKKKILP